MIRSSPHYAQDAATQLERRGWLASHEERVFIDGDEEDDHVECWEAAASVLGGQSLGDCLLVLHRENPQRMENSVERHCDFVMQNVSRSPARP